MATTASNGLAKARGRALNALAAEYPAQYDKLLTEKAAELGFERRETTIVKVKWVAVNGQGG